MVWNFASLEARSYLDGQQVGTKATAAGRTLNTGGTIVLGQDQDEKGGRFDTGQAFAGQLYQLNIWSRALEAGEIEGMAADGLCGKLEYKVAEDIVLSWQHFLDANRCNLQYFYFRSEGKIGEGDFLIIFQFSSLVSEFGELLCNNMPSML